MATFVVLEPPSGTVDEAAERAAFLRDGFSFPAFIVAPIWLLWHRLWIEALAVIAVMVALSAAAEITGLGFAGSVASLLVSLFVGLEGNGLRAAALRRRGWHEWGVVEADTLDDAETRYALARNEEEAPEAAPDVETPSPRPSGQVPAGRSGPVFGLLDYPGGA